MSDDLPRPETASPAEARSEARAAEAAAIRRRWITLGEVLAVIGVVISALALWNSWSERNDSKAVQVADAQRASTRADTLTLIATGPGQRTVTLRPAAVEQTVQSQKIRFPSALGVAAAETTGEPRIEAAWFEHALKKARGAAHLPDNSRGDERLPVAITTHFLVDGAPHEDVALYDIGYTITGHWLAGHSVTLRGLSRVGRVKPAVAQARLDARWKTLFPAK